MDAQVCCYRCAVCWETFDDEDDAEDCCSLYADSSMPLDELDAIAARVYAEFMASLEAAGQRVFQIEACPK